MSEHSTFFLSRRLGILVFLAAGGLFALGSRVLAGPPAPPPPGAPEVALLSTEVGGDTTELFFQRAGDARLSAPALRFRHAEDATVLGAVVPGTRIFVAVAGMQPSREPSWASALLRLEEGKEAAVLADRVYVSTRPLVTASGRIFVQRGRAGLEPTPEQARAGELRTDELTIDEIDLASGRSRTVHATTGYISFLAGSLGDELFVYRVSHGQADLIGLDADSGAVRVLVSPFAPFARDFSVDAAARALLYTQLDPDTGQWVVERLDLATLQREVLARGPSMALAAHPWPGAAFAFNPDGERGLHVSGAEQIASAPLGPGVDFLRAFTRDAAWAVGLHTVPSTLSRPFVVHTRTGEPVLLAHPGASRIDVAGFLEGDAP